MVKAAGDPRDVGTPIRFVPGARRAGELVFRTDANASA